MAHSLVEDLLFEEFPALALAQVTALVVVHARDRGLHLQSCNY